MGIVNRDGALYMATGIDNSGLYSGRREAIGIIKAMAGQITSFDVFSGIGISAATAFASAAKSSYDFEKEFQKNMLEVATISTQVTDDMTGFMNQVMAITQEIPIKAPEAAKALYQIVSAGHDGADGMKILEVSAKSAVGGLTDTATAADAITTVLNAYKMSADEASNISDQLFTTVRLGKTTFGELGQSIAQVAPIAASYGVEIDQVLAAVASLTKQGTPTAQAMTQIRAAIIGTSKVLGDGAFESRTFQEALAEVATMANGSESKLRELVPEIEAVNGVLGMTGKNAQAAASDLGELQSAVGATEAAFGKMKDEVGNQMILLSNNIQAALRPMGEALLKNVSEAAKVINHGFETGDIQNNLENLKKILIGVAGAYITYKSSTIGATSAEAFHSAKLAISNNLRSLQNKVIGESILAKEKERVYQEAYNASLEKTITEEQQAKLSKMNLKAGSDEYIKALADQAVQEKKNADGLVVSLAKQVETNKLKLASAKENLDISHKAVEAAKAEFNVAFEANDLAALEVAQTKMNAAAKREEAAATNVSTSAKKLKSTESKLLIATTSAENAATRINTATTVADTAVTNVATGAKNKLKVATIALWGVMKANPLGAILTMISFATTAYMLFADKIKETETAQSRLNRLQKATVDNMANEQAELRLLLSVAKNELLSKEEREKAIKKLNDISPEYLGNLSLENLKTQEATDSIDAYTKAIEKNAKMKAAQDMVAEKYKQQLDYEKQVADLQLKRQKANNRRSMASTQYGEVIINTNSKELIDNDIKDIQAKKKQVQNEIEQILSFAQNQVEKKPVSIPVKVQLESEQSYLNTLLDKKAEIEARLEEKKQKGLFVNAYDKAELAAVNEELTITNEKIISLSKNASDVENKKSSSITEEIKVATEKVFTIKQELADLRSGKISAEAGKTVKEVIEGKVKDLKAAEDALATLTGKDKSSDKKLEDEQKKQLEKQKALYKDLLDLRLQNQQEEINLMADGSEKKIAQINLDYDKETAAILAKEKEWKEAQGGKLTEEQTVEIRTSLVQSYVKKEKSTGLVSSEQLAEEKRMMSEYLKEYGTYLEKRQAITELYNERIRKATTDGEKLSLGEEMKKALSAVDDEAQKKTSIITKLFSDMSKRTVTDIRTIADEAQSMLDYVNEGEFKTGSDGNGLFGLTKEQFDILSKSPEKLQAIKDEIANINKEADRMDTSFNKISGGLKKIFSAGDDSMKMKEGLEDISDGMGEIMRAGQFLADTFSQLGDAFGSEFLTKIADGLNVAMDAVNSAMDGAKAGAMFGPIGAAAGAAIGLVSSLAVSIAKIHDAKNEKRIQRLQDQIDTLDKSYDKLGDSIEKAYSKDASKLIEDQNKLLEQQKILIQQQIREEQEKKKTDKDRIKDWQDQLEEIDKTLADNKEKAKDAIFGEDLQSAIDNFAQAYVDAWAAGEDRAKSMKDIAKNMIKQMIVELIKSKDGIGPAVEQIRDKLLEFWKDGVITGGEQAIIDKMVEDAANSLDGKLGWADKYLKGDDSVKSLVSSDSISDTIIDGLKSGKSGIKDFASSFEDMMREAVLNSLKTKYLEGPLKEFQKKFSELSESGGQLTEAEIEELRDMYADIISGAKDQFDSLKEISGLDFTNDSDNTLKGAYAKASQESIDLLAGQTGAQRVAIESIRDQMKFIYDLQVQGWKDVKDIKEFIGQLKGIAEKIKQTTEEIKESTDDISDTSKRTAEAVESTLNVKVKMT